MKEGWSYQVCKRCGCNQHLSYQVKDELWAKLPLPWNENSVLCIECFLEELEKAYPNLDIDLDDFTHLAIIGEQDFGGTLLDSDYGDVYKKIYLKI